MKDPIPIKAPSRGKATAQRSSRRNNEKPTDSTSRRNTALAQEGLSQLDDIRKFRKLCRRLQVEKKPKGQVEKFLVRRACLCMVQLEGAPRLQADYIASLLNPRIVETPADRLQQLFELVDGQRVLTKEGLPGPLLKSKIKEQGFTARLSADAVANLVSFQRYESAVEAKFFRTLKELDRQQDQRRRREADGLRPISGRKTASTVKKNSINGSRSRKLSLR